ncbi:hypothetical protein E2I00_002171, partial [Balaenoptera physalus]
MNQIFSYLNFLHCQKIIATPQKYLVKKILMKLLSFWETS